MDTSKIISNIKYACTSLEEHSEVWEEYKQALCILELSVALLTRQYFNKYPHDAIQETVLTDAEIAKHAAVTCQGLRGEAGVMAREIQILRKHLKLGR